MDGFDHLLASSTTPTMESNPFDNPFMKRSSSPDPWASFRHDLHDDTTSAFDSAPAQSAFEHEQFSSRHVINYSDHIPESPNPAKTVLHEDAEAITPTDEFVQPFASSETASVSSTQAVLSPSSSAVQTPSLLSRAESAQNTPEQRPTSPEVAQSVPQTPPPQSQFFTAPERITSPLEDADQIHQSFASLALGGESLGWRQDSYSSNGDTSPIVNSQSNSRKEETLETPIVQIPPDGRLTVHKTSTAQPLFSIVVDDPQKLGDPIRPYIMYTVHTKTASPLFRQSAFSVLRRYSDFLWLYEALTLNNPGVFVPPLPEKSSFGRFESQFIQQRRSALEKCIQKIANHSVLQADPDLKLFLESDGFALEIKQRKLEMAQERGGLMSTIGQTIVGPKFYETDEWFDSRRAYLDNLESQLRSLVKAMEVVSKQRSELAIAMGEFGNAIGELSGSDLSKQLSHSLVVMSDVQKRAGDLQNAQAQEDIDTFMSTVDEYARIITSVRITFASRVRCHARWQTAESEARRTKQTHERARNQGSVPQDRVPHSLIQIAEAERKALDAKQDFDRCSKLIKSEMARFELERIEDFKKSMERFLEGMILRQQELIASWENYQELLLKKVNAIQNPLNQRRIINTP